MELTTVLGWIIALLAGCAIGVIVGRSRSEAALARVKAEGQAAVAQVRAETDAAVAVAEAQRDAAVQRFEEIAGDRETLANQFKVLSDQTLAEQQRRAEAAAEQRLKSTEALMTPVKDGLTALNTQLNRVETARSAQAAELSEQVRQVVATSESLRRETSTLSTALRKPQVRGAWGELQLHRVVEIAGMLDHCDFYEQASTVTSSDAHIRPDMKIMLGEGKFVYVDSKVPLSAFLDAQEARSDDERQTRLTQFGTNVKSHVDQLSAKQYWKSDTGTPEFVILFIPSEALATEALAQRPDLHEYAAARNIVIATPTSLIGLLRAVAYGWKQAALADSAAEVFSLGREIYDRLITMGEAFAKLGRSLQQSVNHYNSTLGSLETRVLVSARRFRDLQVTEKELSPQKGVEQAPRALSAPELIADADGQHADPRARVQLVRER
ncbi:DNA recombination protein RmuC [Propionimicrobium sp. PCR01-08-3]|uniref:DNA recombination protein RmuC n=1 Tax=Propionimicrobium sp. PCR01-08-3 TaxID=3052086 RepID=UPI00255C846E|nr:DNA recombination protein RmuC [Propionimicrobium sp. PCR01-08-3]WIY81856.1 DNA recombination protein RmuC [Propionimicrobium sp. PCR01-08-3]